MITQIIGFIGIWFFIAGCFILYIGNKPIDYDLTWYGKIIVFPLFLTIGIIEELKDIL